MRPSTDSPLASLVWITPDAESHIVYCARVSNPKSQQLGANPERLINYLVAHKHWSPFEMASACFEVNTTRDISAQILRHRSFSFQEFSQRYSDISVLTNIPTPHLRRQDNQNRQASHSDLYNHLDPDKLASLYRRTQQLYEDAGHLYQEMVSCGVAKECARKVLPINSPTRLYMSGTIRSWIHYLQVRTGVETQLEHRQIALAIAGVLSRELPSLSNLITNQSDVA
jgi:thymidylate synthase (FAD)